MNPFHFVLLFIELGAIIMLTGAHAFLGKHGISKPYFLFVSILAHLIVFWMALDMAHHESFVATLLVAFYGCATQHTFNKNSFLAPISRTREACFVYTAFYVVSLLTLLIVAMNVSAENVNAALMIGMAANIIWWILTILTLSFVEHYVSQRSKEQNP